MDVEGSPCGRGGLATYAYMSYTFQTSNVSVDEIAFHCVPNRKMFQTIFPAIWLKGLSCRNCFDSSVVALARELETR